jgi:hypothetical protein
MPQAYAAFGAIAQKHHHLPMTLLFGRVFATDAASASNLTCTLCLVLPDEACRRDGA